MTTTIKALTADQVRQNLTALVLRAERLEREAELHAAAGKRDEFDRVAATIAELDREMIFAEAQLNAIDATEAGNRTADAQRQAEKRRAELRRQAAEAQRLAGEVDKQFAAAATTLKALKAQLRGMNSVMASRAARPWNVTASAAYFGLEDFLEMRRIRTFHRAPLQQLLTDTLAVVQISEGR
jgi:hypothetical protein